MKRSIVIVLLSVLVLNSCKTMEGASRAIGNLFSNRVHESFDGQFIVQDSLKEHKVRHDELSGQGKLISYSGLDIPAEQVRTSNIVDSPAINRYLNKVIDKLLGQWDGTPVNVQVQIVDRRTFSPYADPMGMISVPLGALENVESEDEIALLLGHELSHLLLRHHERDKLMAEQEDTISTIANTVIMANVLKDTKVVRNDKKVDFNYNPTEQGQKNISKAAVYSYIINGLSDNVWSTAWQRTQEEEADLLAIDLAKRAGYAIRASTFNLQRLADFEGKQQGILPRFFAQKTEALQIALQEMNMKSVEQELNTFVKEGISASFNAASDYLKKQHMSPQIREENVRAYANREYQDVIRQRVNYSSWEKLINAREVKLMFDGYAKSFSAAAAITDGDLIAAARLAKESLNPVVESHPGIREVMFNLRTAQQRHDTAAQNLALIKKWQHASHALFDKKIEWEMGQNQHKTALRFIDKAEKTFGSQSIYVLQKAIAQATLGQTDEAVSTLEKCSIYPEQKHSCELLLAKIKQAA